MRRPNESISGIRSACRAPIEDRVDSQGSGVSRSFRLARDHVGAAWIRPAPDPDPVVGEEDVLARFDAACDTRRNRREARRGTGSRRRSAGRLNRFPHGRTSRCSKTTPVKEARACGSWQVTQLKSPLLSRKHRDSRIPSGRTLPGEGHRPGLAGLSLGRMTVARATKHQQALGRGSARTEREPKLCARRVAHRRPTWALAGP